MNWRKVEEKIMDVIIYGFCCFAAVAIIFLVVWVIELLLGVS